MSVDLSGLPQLPDTGTLRSNATSIKNSAKAVKTLCDDAHTRWQGIQSCVSCNFGNEQIYSALNIAPEYGEGVKLSGKAVGLALDAYCDEIDGLKSRYNAAVADAQVCFDPEAETPDGKNPEEEAQQEVNAVATLMAEMEQRCADSIKAADPGNATPVPNYPTAAGAAVGSTTETLGRLRTVDFEFTVSASVTVRTLDYSRLEIHFADGSRLTSERLVLTETSVRADLSVRGTVPAVDGSPRANTGGPPRWAKLGGNLLGFADIGITAWGASTDEWNDDLVEHPEYSDAERNFSVGKSTVLRAGGGAAGGAAGAYVGAAAGAALFGALGTAILPVAGTAAGIAVGGWLGAMAGGFIGGQLGEWTGGTIDNFTDGESFGDSIGDAWNDLWS